MGAQWNRDLVQVLEHGNVYLEGPFAGKFVVPPGTSGLVEALVLPVQDAQGSSKKSKDAKLQCGKDLGEPLGVGKWRCRCVFAPAAGSPDLGTTFMLLRGVVECVEGVLEGTDR